METSNRYRWSSITEAISRQANDRKSYAEGPFSDLKTSIVLDARFLLMSIPRISVPKRDIEAIASICKEMYFCTCPGDSIIDGIIAGIRAERLRSPLDVHRKNLAQRIALAVSTAPDSRIQTLVQAVVYVSARFCRSYYACLWVASILRVFFDTIILKCKRPANFGTTAVGIPASWRAPKRIGHRKVVLQDTEPHEVVTDVGLCTFNSDTVPTGSSFEFLYRKNKPPLVILRDFCSPRTRTSAVTIAVIKQVLSRSSVNENSSKADVEREADWIVSETRRISQLIKSTCAVKLGESYQSHLVATTEKLARGEEMIIEDATDHGRNAVPLRIKHMAKMMYGAPLGQRVALTLAALKLINRERRHVCDIGDVLACDQTPIVFKRPELVDKWTQEEPDSSRVVNLPTVPNWVPPPSTQVCPRVFRRVVPKKNRKTRRGVRRMKHIRKTWEVINRELFRLD